MHLLRWLPARLVMAALVICQVGLAPIPSLATPMPIPRTGLPLEGPAGPPSPREDNVARPASAPLLAVPSAEEEGRASALRPVGAARQPLNPPQVLQHCSPGIVAVLSVLPREGPVRGTGFFVAAGGLVVTSHHLVDGAQTLRIKTRDGQVHDKVQVIAARPTADLVILKVNGLSTPEPILPLADSQTVGVGQHVYVIGHPLGLEYSLSDGLVSALRNSEISGTDLIQFSAPVSPGCSGGPLLNDRGEVIGIISLSHPEGQQLNFAIPINYVRGTLATLGKGPQASQVHVRPRATPTR